MVTKRVRFASRLGLGSGFDSIERVRFANQGSIRADNKGSIRLVRESNPGRLRDRQGFDSLLVSTTLVTRVRFP